MRSTTESKLAVEKILHWYAGAYGLRFAALRYFNAAGADPDGELGEDHDPETHLIPLAIAAALGKGALLQRPSFGEALRTGAIFGIVEAITPVIGWAAGRAASGYIAAFDHWIAFGLLTAIGANMIWDSMRRPKGEEKPRRHSFGVLVVTAIGTSIDAMAVGVTLALLDADHGITPTAWQASRFPATLH